MPRAVLHELLDLRINFRIEIGETMTAPDVQSEKGAHGPEALSATAPAGAGESVRQATLSLQALGRQAVIAGGDVVEGRGAAGAIGGHLTQKIERGGGRRESEFQNGFGLQSKHLHKNALEQNIFLARLEISIERIVGILWKIFLLYRKK